MSNSSLAPLFPPASGPQCYIRRQAVAGASRRVRGTTSGRSPCPPERLRVVEAAYEAEMGISGLLPVLKSITEAKGIEEYRGKTLAIDGYCWFVLLP